VLASIFGVLVGAVIGLGLSYLVGEQIPNPHVWLPLVTAGIGGILVNLWQSQMTRSLQGHPIRAAFLWTIAVVILLAGLILLALNRG